MRLHLIAWCAVGFMLLLLCTACAPGEPPAPYELDNSTPGITRLRGVSAALQVDGIQQIRYADERYAYLLANISEGEKGKEISRMVIARYDTQTQGLETLYRGELSWGSGKMSVERLETGEVVVFTDNMMLVDPGQGGAAEVVALDEVYCQWGSDYSAAARKLAFSNTTNDLYVMDLSTGEQTLCFEAVTEPGEGEAIQNPYMPKFSDDGSKLAFIKGGGDLSHYESIVCCDTQGNVLFETPKIQRHPSDSMAEVELLWWGDRLVFLQSHEGDTGAFCAVEVYDSRGRRTDDYMVGTDLTTFSSGEIVEDLLLFTELSRWNRVGLLDLTQQKAWNVYIGPLPVDEDERFSGTPIHTAGLSPTGNKIIMVEGDDLVELEVEQMERMPIPNTATIYQE